MAKEKAGATEVVNYEEAPVLETLNDLTAGRGPDACIDAVGMESHIDVRPLQAYDRAKQAMGVESDRPHALREAIMACANGCVVSVIGVYGGFVDKLPMGSIMNRSLTLRAGQCHVHRYMEPLMKRILAGEIDPSFVITHRMALDDAPRGYAMFRNKQDNSRRSCCCPDPVDTSRRSPGHPDVADRVGHGAEHRHRRVHRVVDTAALSCPISRALQRNVEIDIDQRLE
jgi:threonine dehydrogenase-like Zn-dependent dehydrogenase